MGPWPSDAFFIGLIATFAALNIGVGILIGWLFL